MDKKTKVLFCGLDSALGGIEVFCKTYFDKLNSNFKIDFLKITESIYYEKYFISKGSSVFKITSRRKNFLKYYFQLFKFIKMHPEYKIIHHHLNSASSIAPIVIGKILGRITIAHSHNVYKNKKIMTRIFNKINKFFLPLFSTNMLACSHEAGVSLFRNKNFQVIKNAIDASTFGFNLELRNNIRNKLGVHNKKVIGHVGSMKYQKNHIFLLDIFSKLIKISSDYHLLLIGDGELKSEIIQRIKLLNIVDNVSLIGVVDNVNEYLNAMDLFIFPSLYEGLGIVLIEAQSNGLVCLASDKVPTEALITELSYSISLSESAEVWANKSASLIEKYSNHENQRKKYSKIIIDKDYDIKSNIKELESIYEKAT